MFGIFPPDEYRLYDAPTVTITSLVAAAAPVQIIGADPTRVAIIISTDGTNTIFVAPGNPAGLTNAQGIAIEPASTAFALSFLFHGALVQLPWLASSPNNCTATVVSLSLSRPPELYGYRGVFHPIQATEPTVRPTRRRGASVLMGSRRPVALPAILRRRIPSLYGEQ